MFNDKIILITGSSRGIGREVAIEFSKRKAIVIMNYKNDTDMARETFEIIKAFSPNSIQIQADISDPEQVKAMFENIKKKFGRIDILVNNAGISNDKLFINSTEEDWITCINTNVIGLMSCCHAAMKRMIRQKAGKIINISSVSIYDSKIGQTYYAASKAAVVAFSKALAKEAAKWKVNVNVVVPGLISTDMTDQTIKDMDSELKKIPLGRIGTPQDVTSLILFLSGDQSDYITGGVFTVDGGLSA
ncbi:3-oxoacyl-ACP reductase FabG [Paenibacillus sp. FSL L8-0436]|uniref:3-oxoacyl-ACP reductase FabG n=1 Tax=Paenibacillus sp. FSL L8-0436 TaxID=2954686 RepID=UPI0031594724